MYWNTGIIRDNEKGVQFSVRFSGEAIKKVDREQSLIQPRSQGPWEAVETRLS